jgi:hypothetical protein
VPCHHFVAKLPPSSNHYYPLWNSKLGGDLKTMRNSGKAYLVGEYDWSVPYSRCTAN